MISRSLSSVHIPSKLEPPGLSRYDGEKTDGVTLTPWFKGQPLIWDATCFETFADSYLYKTSYKARQLAYFTAMNKYKYYSNLSGSS